MARTGEALERLCDIMARLRAEGGCPWDREQDLRSLRPYLLEEAFEVLDEMDRVAHGRNGKGSGVRSRCHGRGGLLIHIPNHATVAHRQPAPSRARGRQLIATALPRKAR